MKSILSIISLLFISFIAQSQINNAKTETVKVFGNCGMCETTIEKAAFKSKTAKADWNEDTKLATITYDSTKTNLNAVLKSIALAGYDNVSFLAPTAAYNKLHGCCKYERELKTADKNDANTSQQHSENNTEALHTYAVNTNQKAVSFQSIFDNYFLLKDALIATDNKSANQYANSMLTAVNAIEMSKLATNEHNAWMSVEANIKDQVKSIAAANTIEAQRNMLDKLSATVLILIKASKHSAPIFLQHCPMANNGKGANWLSTDAIIKNPYYGAMMLGCGKTIDTIQ